VSGRIIYTPKKAHICGGFPDVGAYPVGTIWECDEYECAQQWVVFQGMRYPDPPLYWRKLTELNKEGRDL
jgi:hypothetical protein